MEAVHLTEGLQLPFGTSWAALKDWIRSVCEVDHIEMFPQSTSAWVRVKGRDNFNRAWGRSLCRFCLLPA